MNNQIFNKQVRWQHGTSGSGANRSHNLPSIFGISIGIVVAASLIIRLLLALPNSGGSFPPAPTAVFSGVIPNAAAATIPTSVPVPTATAPMCTSAQGYLTIIVAQEATGDYPGAASTADSALRITGLCPNDQTALKQKAVSVGISALYTAPFSDPLDIAAQQRLVDRYEMLRSQAEENSISRDTDLQIARRAFAISQFLLAKTALDNAYAAGQFHPAVDRDITHLYVSSCYGLGMWYSTATKGSALYHEGLAWLATSHVLSVKYHTGQGEAASKLTELVSPTEAHWPAPAATPLLKRS